MSDKEPRFVRDIVIRVRPGYYFHPGEGHPVTIDLEIECRVNGREYHIRDVMHQDDFHSRWELMCKRAMESLGEAIREGKIDE